MNRVDIEKNNRETFRVLLDTLSMPGNSAKIEKLFDSYALSVASVLLYSEVSYCNLTSIDFSLIDAITNAKKEKLQNADYIFCNDINEVLSLIKKGTFLNPEYSATIIVMVESFGTTSVRLKGPGIDQKRIENYPIDENTLHIINKNNKNFPLGNEIFFLNESDGIIKALSRTTLLENV